jgi:4'-phosphopantetheinyl transferase
MPTEPEEVILRRLCTMLALKQAYIKAIGQPAGFDLSRLEFNLPGETCRGDGYPLTGWEFRLWQSQIAIINDQGEIEEHQYQCASAFFRGTAESTFIWQKDKKDLETWVQFLTIDQLITVLPKLKD